MAVYPKYDVLGWYSVGEEVISTFLPLNVLSEFNQLKFKPPYVIGLRRGCVYSQANAAIQSEPTFLTHEPKGSGRVEGMLLNSTYCSLLIGGGG